MQQPFEIASRPSARVVCQPPSTVPLPALAADSAAIRVFDWA
ncbi:MAG: hypothetical protein R3E45_06755 [Rhodocyclaceae bacterium]